MGIIKESLFVSIASWILDLLSLPTKFVTKKLKELRTVFQSSFHHAPCIRVATVGPLSLRDLQNLTPSKSMLYYMVELLNKRHVGGLGVGHFVFL